MSAAYFSFVAFVIILTVILGPAVVLIMKNAVLRGRRGALITAIGVFSSDLIWVTASIAGLTALLVAYRPAFEALRFVGAAYLIYLGVRLIVTRGHGGVEDESQTASARGRGGRAYAEGVLSELSNPKTLLIFTSDKQVTLGPACISQEVDRRADRSLPRPVRAVLVAGSGSSSPGGSMRVGEIGHQGCWQVCAGYRSANQAEGVTRRVVEHAEVAVRGRLVLGPHRAKIQDARLRGIDVTDREIQMELLRMSTTRPGRRHPVVDALERERSPTVGLSGLIPPPGGARAAQSRSEPSSSSQPKTEE